MSLIALFVMFFTLMLGMSNSAPASIDCQKEIKNAGATASFDAMVAHGLHSMTLDDLKLFDPSATEDNYIPTVNFDLRSDQAILPYAKFLKTNDSDQFLTNGMRVLDLVLTHMNEKDWDLTNFSPLERIVHAFHMREVWAHVKVELNKIGKTFPTPSIDACQCILDLENNGVMRAMRFEALAIREPALVYGNPCFSNRNFPAAKRAQYVEVPNAMKANGPKYDPKYVFEIPDAMKANGPKYDPKYVFEIPDAAKANGPKYDPKYVFEIPDAMKAKDPNYLALVEKENFNKHGNSPLKSLLNQDKEAMPPLNDAKSWQRWRGKTNTPPEHSRDTALFLYCAIAKAHVKKN